MKRAFSLIELVVVVLIIAAIATIAIPRASAAARTADATAMAAHIRRIVDALRLHDAEFGAWPSEQLELYVTPPELVGRIDPKAFTQVSFGRAITFPVWAGAEPSGQPEPLEIFILGQVDAMFLSRLDSLLDDGNPETGDLVRVAEFPMGIGGVTVQLRLTID